MRKIYFVLSLSLMFFCATKAQCRYPLNSKSAWRVDSVDSEWKVAEKTKFYIQGDTTINSMLYYKLYKSGLMILDEPFYYNNIYVGAIRDADNKIFYINKKTSKERCLFDFNLKVGDTIKSDIAKGKTIKKIDTLQDGRKIFNYDLGHYTAGYIIEGIGTNGGLFSLGTSLIFLHSGDMACYLICYSEDGTLKYQCPDNGSNCDIVSSPLIKLNATDQWKYISTNAYDESYFQKNYQYFISGDTSIGGKVYFKLFVKYNQLVNNPEGYSLKNQKCEYTGALRDGDNRYYFVKQGSSAEELLYDFGLKEGDKITAKVFNGSTVYDIDTILDNRKVFYLSNTKYGEKYFAGFGSTTDFLNGSKVNTYLKCYSENGVAVYHLRGEYDCELKYKDASYSVCNNIQILPNYFSGSQKQVKVSLCYQVPSSNWTFPKFESYDVKKVDNVYKINLYYEDENSLTQKDTFITKIIENTVPLGLVEEGYYNIEVTVNSINRDFNNDTTFNLIRFDSDFFAFRGLNDTKNMFKGNDLKVYPVPTTGILFIETNDLQKEIRSIEVYDLLGIKIFQKTEINANKIELNLSGLKKGVYFIKIQEQSMFLVQKIIVD